MIKNPGIFMPDSEEKFNITICLSDFINNNYIPSHFFVIKVWEPTAARSILKYPAPDNSFVLQMADEGNYTRKDIIKKAKNIWKNGLVPIEIIQITGAYFFALPYNVVKKNEVFDYEMLPAENKIPNMNDFFGR